METINRIKRHYRFADEDIRVLKELYPVMEKYREDFPVAFYNTIKDFEDAKAYLKDEETVKRHQEALKDWFMNLFSGEYGPSYIRELERVGLAHVKISLPAHYVNASMHFVGTYVMGILQKEIRDCTRLTEAMASVEKILDINLDILTSSYIEEEKRHFFLSQEVETSLIKFATQFSHGLNLVLVLGLVIMGILVVGLFFYDMTHIFEGDIEKGLLSTLGSLLMLWVVIELVNTEIKHLKGGKFAIKVFVSVALVAVIRKILVGTLSAEHLSVQMSLIAGVAVLGVVYWLIAKTE